MSENFIHSSYSKNQFPKLFTILSDIHGTHRQFILPKTNYLLLCGDFTIRGYGIKDFIQWIENQQVDVLISVLGNHEKKQQIKTLEKIKGKIKEVHALDGNYLHINEFQFIGSGYKFNIHKKEINKINPKYPLICLSHEPPFNMMDYGIRMRQLINGEFFHAGSKVVQQFIQKVQPDLHCFGHCHSSHGICKVGKTTFVNGSIVDDNNSLCFKPLQLKYYNKKFIPLTQSKCITLNQFIQQINQKPSKFIYDNREYKEEKIQLIKDSIVN
ncbi:hypothetical protein ENUP19_0041G0120 [Entamoeba nuttalli]|uniref:Ser/thr protein phosphatase family protein n=2 Tax=Entamoeba nuttalli TaxID=412467 RepID=K2HA77_ENTNP|nr:ser/thr protein phosphatase family protein [Entamoeba nuttalli P19]EKE39489.1 ser/thr protein phosphatase family protein [Entamoeba nuttalli P19]|eukprot:XP_008858176.1 ser/thr protein phosphatase family protein [Entamoeba nuttalli P19]